MIPNSKDSFKIVQDSSILKQENRLMDTLKLDALHKGSGKDKGIPHKGSGKDLRNQLHQDK